MFSRCQGSRIFSDIWYFLDVQISKLPRYLIFSRCQGSWIFSDIWNFLDAMVAEFFRYLIFFRCHGCRILRLIFSRYSDVEFSQISDIFSMFRCRISQISDIFSMFRCWIFPDIWYFLDVQMSEFLRYLIFSRCHGSWIFPDIWYFLDVQMSEFLRYLSGYNSCQGVEFNWISCIEFLSTYLNFLRYLVYNSYQDAWIFSDIWNTICIKMSMSSLTRYRISNFCQDVEIFQISCINFYNILKQIHIKVSDA